MLPGKIGDYLELTKDKKVYNSFNRKMTMDYVAPIIHLRVVFIFRVYQRIAFVVKYRL